MDMNQIAVFRFLATFIVVIPIFFRCLASFIVIQQFIVARRKQQQLRQRVFVSGIES